jgi:electron transfer flavoprotein alpha subunit
VGIKLNAILVLVEQRDNEIDTFSLQLLQKARQLADGAGLGVKALISGHNISQLAGRLSDKGADEILVADSPLLSPYNPEVYTRVLTDIVRDTAPALTLLGYTFQGMEIGPAIATRSGISLLSNCVDIELSPEKRPIITRPMYGETVNVRMEASLPLIVSLRRGLNPGKASSTRSAATIPVAVKIVQAALRIKVMEIIKPRVGEVDFKKASVIVAVGRGIKKAENIELARKLAQALGGVIAGSRPVIDMGWLPPEYQIGLSGNTVSPKIYIACGISGAAQHVAGMVDSQMIIAINKDPNAPIFNSAHYAIVKDLFDVMPALIAAAGNN